MKVVVVGCTHAGTAAIKTIVNEHSDVAISVYERNDNISFLSCGIAMYVGGVVKDPQGLFYSSPEELSGLGVAVHMEHDVTEIDFDNKKVRVTNLKTGDQFEDSYDKLVLTVGSWPILPPISGRELDGVLLCKNYRQAQEIFARKNDAQKVVVVGGGYIGIELVEAFAEDGKDVTLIDGLDRILNKYLDSEFTDVVESDLRARGIKLQLNEQVESFEGENGKVSKVVTAKGTYEADMVILCVGFRPNTELVKGKLETLPNGAVLVNEYMQTSRPEVFAAGDTCAVHYNPNGGSAYIPLATNAVRQGALVGRNLKEPKVAYRGTQSTSGLQLFGWNIGSTGVTVNSAPHFGLDVRSVYVEDNYRPEFMPSTEKVFMKLVYEVGSGRIVGGQLMSKYDITQSANTLSLAIQNKMTIEDLAYVDFFFQPHYDRPWNYLNILAQAAVEQERQLAAK